MVTVAKACILIHLIVTAIKFTSSLGEDLLGEDLLSCFDFAYGLERIAAFVAVVCVQLGCTACPLPYS